jgi:lipoate-protein ligase A
MALDEALASSAAAGGEATLRVYSFDPPAITIGRFQAIEGFVDIDACGSHGVEVTRRPTGGLAILHKDDFTYCVTRPAGAPGGTDKERHFKRIAEGIIAALRSLGIEADIAAYDGSAPADGWCFEREFGVDIEWWSRKICGSAQRISGGSVLQHGSLFLRDNRSLLERLSKGERGGVSGRAPVTVSEAGGRPVGWAEMAAAFEKYFPAAIGMRLERGEITQAERSLADRLVREKYGSEGWLRGRA